MKQKTHIMSPTFNISRQGLAELKTIEYRRFENIKHIRPDGSEYWLARELSVELGYTQWRNFSQVIDKAKLACKNSGFDIDDHFADVSKMVEIGSNAHPHIRCAELICVQC